MLNAFYRSISTKASCGNMRLVSTNANCNLSRRRLQLREQQRAVVREPSLSARCGRLSRSRLAPLVSWKLPVRLFAVIRALVYTTCSSRRR